MDELRPAAADHVRILRIKLHRAVDAVRLLAGDQRAARSTKQIQHSLARFRRVENRLDRQRGRFLRRMHIFPRIVTLDVPDRRLAAVAEPLAVLPLMTAVKARFRRPMVIAVTKDHSLVPQEEAQKKLEANGERASAYRQKIWALQKRRQAVQEGKPGATTGEEGKTATTEEKVEAEKQRRQAASDNADAAAKRVAEIDKQLARERKTELENEIDDIIALRDEYKQLIQTMLDYEKSKPEKEQDKAKIAELEGKLAGADQTAEDRIAKAREKAAQKMKDDVASYQERFQESEQSIQDRRAEAAQDRKIDETLKNDPAAGQQMLEGLIAQYQKEAAAAKAQFEKELQDAQADGKIDDNERKKLDDAHSAYTRAESMVDKYSDRLRSAQEGTAGAAERTQVSGSFLASALQAMLGGGGTEAERTANATEQMVRQSKETNKLLKRMDNASGTTTLAYK